MKKTVRSFSSYQPPKPLERITKRTNPLAQDTLSVYTSITELITDPDLLSKQEKRWSSLTDLPERRESINQTKSALEKGFSFPILNSTDSPTSFQEFLNRLKQDGGEKILDFEYSFLHVKHTRFNQIIEEIKGLSLNDTLLQLKWHQNQEGDRFIRLVNESIVSAKEKEFDLEKTFIAYAKCIPTLESFSPTFIKKYVRGIGKYGVSPNPIGCKVTLILQQREREFDSRLNDPLEWIRIKLRNTQVPFTQTSEQVYQETRKKQPIKEIYC